MANPKVFVSRGTPYTPAQDDFCKALLAYMQNRGVDPVTIGANKHGVRQPAELARDEIESCHGAVVLAFKRIHIAQATEKPGSSSAAPADGRFLPTVWNHMEAAMAYAAKLPLLILVERGVHREGMLSKRLEWDALEIDIDTKIMQTTEFIQRFDHWMKYVNERVKSVPRARIDPANLTVIELLGRLTPAQLWSFGTAMVGLLAAVAIAAFAVGAWSAKHDLGNPSQVRTQPATAMVPGTMGVSMSRNFPLPA
jgi:hypothetical protein